MTCMWAGSVLLPAVAMAGATRAAASECHFFVSRILFGKMALKSFFLHFRFVAGAMRGGAILIVNHLSSNFLRNLKITLN